MDLFSIRPGDVVSIAGAGGKTSLLFLLAEEMKRSGLKTLLTTTTKMKYPEAGQYDHIDIGRNAFQNKPVSATGRHFAARACSVPEKVTALDPAWLESLKDRFDITLIEADGAAMKPLKGWNASEPVIPDFTTLTIGVVDISTVGREINSDLVHRLELFTKTTNATAGEKVSIGHLARLIGHPDGLFRRAVGRKVVYVNKVETEEAHAHFSDLRSQAAARMVGGSVHRGYFYS